MRRAPKPSLDFEALCEDRGRLYTARRTPDRWGECGNGREKGSRSSKTAHVLNLLSGERRRRRRAAPGGGDRADGGAAGRAHASPAAPERPILPPIVEVARTNSEALSETIRSALERELEEEQAQDQALERAEEAGEEHAAQPAAEPLEEPERPDDPAEFPLPPPPQCLPRPVPCRSRSRWSRDFRTGRSG